MTNMNAYEVRVAEAHAISLDNLRSYDTYVGEIVRDRKSTRLNSSH